MAITEPCILLPLWKQETHDGTNVPECQLPILSLWRFLQNPEQDKRERLGGVYLSAFRIYRQAHLGRVGPPKICQVTDRYSSYVQQLAWFVWLRVQDDSVATEEDLKYGIERLLGNAREPLLIPADRRPFSLSNEFPACHHQWSTYRFHPDGDIGNL